MKKIKIPGLLFGFTACLLITCFSCKQKNAAPSADIISDISLKRGDIVLCGPPEKQFGKVSFTITATKKIQKEFDLAVALLHSFEYDEAEKSFAKIIDEDHTCAMAYWGVAMSNYHPLWTPPTEEELTKGAKAIAVAQSIQAKSKREEAYINAIAAFFTDWKKMDHHTRSVNFEKAMEKIYTGYPDDKEAAVFYSLALDAAADPGDKTYKNQRKAGAILNQIYPGEPNHPGIVHYIIHSYDYPELANLALPAARQYASIAPSSAHAQHMPSHIFTRLGLWDECIQSNLVSTASAKCYAESAGIKGHWDEELHGLDYLVYSYLQTGENKLAREQCDYLDSIKNVYPVNFKDAYAFTAIPSRYVLENKLWKEAAILPLHPVAFPWEKFPWQEAIIHFTRLMGNVHTGNMDSANAELGKLNKLHNILVEQKDSYKANQVQIQINTAKAWILFANGNKKEAEQLMLTAADMEDNTEKHPVTPGEVIPARELLADMLLQMNQPQKALLAYEADLKTHPNRFNGLYGAGLSAQLSNNSEKAATYYQRLLETCHSPGANRQELSEAKTFLRKQRSL